jgi:dTDP-4-amino-4,6-dideoxygalactose transaminase
VHVSCPALPPIELYAEAMREIWDRKFLTNGGPVHARFEAGLAEFLRTPRIALFANGALALQLALQGLRLRGEVITTPFSFAATSNALVQSGLTPVFADIEPGHLNLDPDHVASLITPRTEAILAVHVFGHPCALDRLAGLAQRHGLALIYDAAHAFGTMAHGSSIAAYGDVAMFSFHATKTFHAIEGGALAFRDPALAASFAALRNHGLGPDGDVQQAGLNAKMNEFQALMGTLMLPGVPAAIAHGAVLEAAYRQHLAGVPGLSFLAEAEAGIEPNHGFLPVLVEKRRFGLSADQLQAELRRFNIFPRRYFHPLISDMTAFRGYGGADPLVRARQAAQQVLALPLYTALSLGDVAQICDIVIGVRHVQAAAAD